jgi:hypothetical protein
LRPSSTCVWKYAWKLMAMLVMSTAAPIISDSAIAQIVGQLVWPAGASGSADGLKRAFHSSGLRSP